MEGKCGICNKELMNCICTPKLHKGICGICGHPHEFCRCLTYLERAGCKVPPMDGGPIKRMSLECINKCRDCSKSPFSCDYKFSPVEKDLAHDPVHSPAHYEVMDGVEAKDIIKAILDEAEDRMTLWQAYCLGNILKYTLRSMKKGSPEENLEKAKTHIDYFMIEGDEDGK